MVQLECSRTTIKNPPGTAGFVANLACEQQLEVALFVNYLVSGFALAVAALCFYHLIKRFEKRLAHFVIMGFSVLLLAANIIELVFFSQSFHQYVRFALGAAAASASGNGGVPGPSVDEIGDEIEALAFAQDLFLPVFFWVTDAFLLYRAWVIWYGKRLALIAPYFLYFASLVSGILCLALFSRTKFLETPWIPALSFSSGVDVVTTSMIAGRLYFHHRRQRKMGFSDSKFFVSALVICVESGSMSTISKLIQFAIPISDRALIVVPLVTIASNLIILRKALGSDIVQSMASEHVSTEIRFGSRNHSSSVGGVGTNLSNLRSPVGTNVRSYGRARRDTEATVGSTVDVHGGSETKLPGFIVEEA